MEVVEAEGKTLEEAVDEASKKLNISTDLLDIEILSNGTKGLFGLVGGRKFRIRAQAKSVGMGGGEKTGERAEKSSGKLQFAKKALEDILQRIPMEGKLRVDAEEKDDSIVLQIRGKIDGHIIGRQGSTLDAIQFIVNKIVNRFPEGRKRIVVDAEGYRERRLRSIRKKALQLGEKARRTGRPVSSDPMSAYERRIMHLALEKEKGIKTESVGSGELRKIIVSPE